MAANSKQRFADVGALRRFDAVLLGEFLGRFPGYMQGRGVSIPAPPTSENMPYDRIVPLFMEPSTDTPADFHEAVYQVNALATEDGRDKIAATAKDHDLTLDAGDGDTNHDFAMKTWLQDADLAERALIRASQWKKRSFRYYRARDPQRVADAGLPDEEARAALREDLLALFKLHAKPSYLKILDFPAEAETWYLIRHHSTPERIAAVNDDSGDTDSYFIKPEAYDVVIINWRDGLLKINAKDRLHHGYRAAFSRFAASDLSFFQTGDVFNLDPLRTADISVLSPERGRGLESVRLKRIKYSTADGAMHTIEDVPFHHRAANGIPFAPPEADMILWADFDVSFPRSRHSRPVRVQAGNKSSYSREADAILIESFLRLRGFMTAVALQHDAAA